MTRRTRTLLLLVTAFVLAGLPAATSAQQIRTAKVGDQIASLLAGLIPVNGGPVGVCSEGGPVVYYANYLVPSRATWNIFGNFWKDLRQDNASFLAFMTGNQVGRGIIMLEEFDEANPSLVAAVFADTRGTGTITNVWPGSQAPALCSVVAQMPPHP